MSPRELRKALKEGRWTSTTGPRSLPTPPEEHPEWRRERMAVAIHCASLFLFNGYDWVKIRSRVGVQGKLLGRGVSRARIQQYVAKGVDFLLERGVFVEVKKRK